MEIPREPQTLHFFDALPGRGVSVKIVLDIQLKFS
jgi:hypothetical protein